MIYADLWEQRSIDPAKVIISAIADAILHEGGIVSKAARMVGLKKVKVGGLEMDLEAIGAHDGDSLAKTLEKLGIASDKPIVMVIDEAQHAQTTEQGRETMFALKSARDAMILGDGNGFRLIATGSNSDRLRTLVSSKDQAFYGAREEHLPELDDSYLQWVLDRSPFKLQLALSVLHQGFDIFSRRPEPLQGLLSLLQDDRNFDPATIDKVFVDRAVQSMEKSHQSFLLSIRSMDELDAAVFRRMAELGDKYTPFDEAALNHYEQLMNAANPGTTAERPTKSAVQSALERLRKESMVWNAGRGLWYIEDSQHTAWVLADKVNRAEGASA